jgi:CMP-N,N'-diacetyllegionaminic acid synthase
MKIVALVPARGGSKGIPRKNLRVIAARPLLVHSIQHGLACPLIDRVIVSTDDREIADTARSAGAEVPFMRPAEFATDYATDLQVFRHFLLWAQENEGSVPDLIVQLRPTAPVRRVATLTLAIEQMIQRTDADSLRSVSIASFTPYKMWTIAEDFDLQPVMSFHDRDWYDLPRQKLPMIYQQNGFVDIVRPRTILEKDSMAGDCILSFTHPDPVIDVDDEDSLKKAEQLILAMQAPASPEPNRFWEAGILQGRLSPSPTGALQNFPADWNSEFDVARSAGLGTIELLVEREHNPRNPIWTEAGRRLIAEARERTGVGTAVICVDYPISHAIEAPETLDYLATLFECCKQLGNIQTCVLPLMEASELRGTDVRRIIPALRRLADAAKPMGMTLAIETHLDASALLLFLGMVAHPLLRVCYDTGNTVPLGHDVAGDIRKLGRCIGHVHIKDKTMDGQNVALGTGQSPLVEAVLALQDIGYAGRISFESVRGQDPLDTARHQLDFIRTAAFPHGRPLIPRICQAMHEAWVATKQQQGYRAGPAIDDEAKIHPAIRPYSELSPESVALEIDTVNGLLALMRQEGYRLKPGAGERNPAPLLDRMQRRAHDMWFEYHRSRGFRHAPVTDIPNKKHRDFLPFDALSPERKELDRSVVMAVTGEIGRAGFGLHVVG